MALSISNIPWNGPVAGARVAYLTETKELILNPTYEQRDKAKLDLFIAGIGDETDDVLFNMLDGQAKEALEEETLQAIQFSKDHLKSLFISKEIQNKEGKPKIIVPINDKKNLEDLSKNIITKLKKFYFQEKRIISPRPQ